MIENLTDLEKFVTLPEGKTLKDLIDSDEKVKVDLNEDLVIKTKAENETFVNNLKSESKLAGEEIAVKTLKQANPDTLTFEGKSVEKLFNHLNTTLETATTTAVDKALKEAKIEPNQKIDGLNKDLDQLRNNLANKTTEFESLVQSNRVKDQTHDINTSILNKFSNEGTISKGDRLLIFNSRFTPKKNEDGLTVFHKDGQVMKNNTTMSPLTIEEVMPDFDKAFAKPNTGGGGGGDDTGGGKAGSFDAFEKEMEKAGKKTGSVEFNEEMSKRIHDKTLTI